MEFSYIKSTDDRNWESLKMEMGSPWLESKYVIFVQFTSKGYCIMARDFVLAWASWFECHLLIDVLQNFIYLLCWVADSIYNFHDTRKKRGSEDLHFKYDVSRYVYTPG